MYLKSLTLKGFKSFADATTLELEPGVTVVVGPNGSGKSNVVDAVAWVLGAQGPRVVRSAKMDDVIFAGTASRAALGRAEVSLVIDNSRHDLPLDFNEVTITRTLFRSGESEYAINGVGCRLLDVQELLSDSGVGRSQHVIIGQGQIDAILSARPEERRLVIEEAAGILKFRRRRERALRRLEASETSLTRLQDLLREVRRQMRPLERQAASAHLHAELGEELGVIRRYLAGVELRNLEQTIRDATEHSRTLETNATSLGEEFRRAEERLQVATDSLAREPDEDLTPQLTTLDRLHERSRGLLALLDERRRSAAAVLAALEAGGDVAALEESRRRAADELEETEREAIEVAPQWEQLASAESALIEAEVEHSERYAGLSRASAPELAERRTAADRARRVLGTISQEATVARTRVADLAVRITARRDRFAALERRSAGLAVELAEGRRTAEEARLTLEGQVTQRRAGEARLSDAVEARHRAESRAEALELALAEARERADLGRLESISGLLGTLRELLVADTSVVQALEGALLGALDAAVLTDPVGLSAAIERLSGRGGALLMAPSQRRSVTLSPLPPGCRWLRDLVDTSDPRIAALLDSQLGGIALTDLAIAEALDLSAQHPDLVLVTAAGDRVARSGVRLSAQAIGATVSALDEARERCSTAVREAALAEEALVELAHAEEHARGLEVEHRVGADALGAEFGAIGRELEEIVGEIASLETESETLSAAVDHHEAEVGPAESALALLEEELRVLEAEEREAAGRFEEADGKRRLLDERARALAALRRDLEVRAAALEERRELLNRRLAELDQSLLERREAVQEAAVRRGAHEAEERAMAGLAAELEVLVEELARRAAVIGAERDRRRALGRQHLERLGGLRRERDTLQRQLSELNEQRQCNEMTVTEARIRHEAAVEALHRDLDIEPAEAIATPRPQLPEGSEPAARARLLERELRDLGPVNPLAAEELSALSERSEFLESQLEDVRRARRELNQVINAVDAEIVDVFAAAYEDVAANFEGLFSMLFPGGEGRLSLTAPDDLLETGVEIEARPAGRNVRRLSLLSGGERSLVAMAYLFSVFRARPAPFYLMDEVEAALDEVNLVRFHGLVNEFRDEAQLIIVSHQKKTMEIADSLYGISMQPGGGSKVISERVATKRPPRAFALEPMGRPS